MAMYSRHKVGTKLIFFFFIFIIVLMTYFVVIGLNVKPGTAPDEQMVLTTSEEMAVGTVLMTSHMHWTEYALDKIEPDFIRKNQQDIVRSVEGAIIRSPIMKGDPVKEVNLIKTGTKSALSAVIHEGMRAVPIPLTKISNAPPLISPGDVVDIIIPKRAPNSQVADPTYVGQTILQNIRVLAVDAALQKAELNEVKGSLPHTLTLEVDALQAEDLGAALRDGQVIISMHSIFTSMTDRIIKKEEEPEVIPEKKVIKVLRPSEPMRPGGIPQ